MTNSLFPYKNAMVVGMGTTGLSCAKFLSQHGVHVIAVDSRKTPPNETEFKRLQPKVEYHADGFDKRYLKYADVVVVSPGVSLKDTFLTAAAELRIPILGDIELFVRFADAPIIGITGSNGKSTVTTLLAEILSTAGKKIKVGGNLGTPALELLSGVASHTDFYILELSSFQLETTDSMNAEYACLLNISEDHMDRYESIEEYQAAKSKLCAGNGDLVYNREDERVKRIAESYLSKNSRRRAISFGLDSANEGHYGLLETKAGNFLARGRQPLIDVAQLKIIGHHNYANALAAAAIAQLIDVSDHDVTRALKRYAGLPHRTQWVANIQGVDWYNDSKGTNVGATLAAIKGLNGNKVLIAGGVGKGADFSPLKSCISDNAVKAVVLFGRDAETIKNVLNEVVTLRLASNLDQAVRQAFELAEQGDRVLFSPACASFDMFENYIDRGNQFTSAVKRLMP